MPKYSFVIPVYNTEKYLDECINSIQNQTYSDFEIILINDGSTDLSGRICDELALKDDRIVVIHNKNSGASNARNTGIESSKGDYIWFVDSDDRISNNNALQKIDNIITKFNIDIIYFKSKEFKRDFCDLVNEQDNYLIEGLYNKKGEDLLVDVENNGQLVYIATSPVNKIFSKQLLSKNNLRFIEKFRCFEEDEFLCKTAFYSSTVYFLNEFLYDVRIRPQSLSTTQSPDVIENKIMYRIELTNMCCSFYDKTKESVQKAMNKFYSYYFLNALTDYAKLENDIQRDNIIRVIKENDNIFKYMFNTHSRYLKVVSAIYYLFGIRAVLKFIFRKCNNE